MNINAMSPEELSVLLGKEVDLSPWGYAWRADREVQDKPEANFIPRRLKRMDEVYRTLLPTLGEKGALPTCYVEKDIMTPQIPKAKDPLLCGLLWVGGINDYQVRLVFPEGTELPAKDAIEVRTYPTAWGWFGWSNDSVLTGPEVSGDGRIWTYTPIPQTIDYAYNQRVKAQTELVCAFAAPGTPVPAMQVVGGSLGTWKKLTFSVEWQDDAVPTWEGHVALVGTPVIEGKKATFTVLYTDVSRFGTDSTFTFILDREKGRGATVLLRELAAKPVCVPDYGLYFCNAEQYVSPADYRKQNEGKQNVRERVRDHEEAKSWEELFRHLRHWRCPAGTEIPDFPEAPEASAVFRVPDKRFETMYQLAVNQLRGPHMWGFLASEVARSALSMEKLGLRKEADRVYDYFLASPGIRSDGDFTDPAGSFEWAKGMRHDMGYGHEGTHCSTGWLLFAMMHRWYMSHDREWITARLPRLKAAAGFIIGETANYAKDFPKREELRCYGLMPPSMLGDYALPASDWRWYASDNAFAQMGLSAFADVLTQIGDPEADYYTREAKRFENDLRRAVKLEALYAPVRRGRSGMSRPFLPRIQYAGGLLLYGKETNVPQFSLGINDLFQGALPLGELGCVIDPDDPAMVGTVDAMEERGMDLCDEVQVRLAHPVADEKTRENEERIRREREGKAVSEFYREEVTRPDRWFWSHFSNLPKISHNANIYLRQDDIPNFLHFFFNHAIMMVGTNGLLWEHEHPEVFVPCKDPDNGTAAWFTENFRNMLVVEDRGILWIAKGTPRAWLEDGKEISAEKVLTFWGELTYRITSHAAEGYIDAEIAVPDYATPPTMKLRLRHPEGKKITSVNLGTVDADGETVTFTAPKGVLKIRAEY